jgi:predicted dehydrogenase
MSRNSKLKTQNSNPPRLGFLGVGWIGRKRMEAIIKSGVAEVVAIADASAELAANAAQLAPAATVIATAEPLPRLLALDLDGIVIATPSALHAAQAVAAFEQGKAVFCQKPLGRNAAEARRVVNAARAADRLLGVDLSYRYLGGMAALRQLIQAGELGDIYALDLTFHNAYGPDKPWFYDKRLSGGGCVIDLGVHLVDLALWALDFPAVIATTSRLFAQGQPLAAGSDQVEDYAIARLDLENGATAQLACSWRLPAGRDAIIAASFYGTKGGAAIRNVNGSFYDFVAERYHGTASEILAAPPDDWDGRAIVDWASRLASAPRFDPAAEHLVNVAAALDSIYNG